MKPTGFSGFIASLYPCSIDWPGLVLGFILGIIASYIGNYYWEKHKASLRGAAPYLTIDATGELIQFHGQIRNTTTSQAAIISTIRATFPTNP